MKRLIFSLIAVTLLVFIYLYLQGDNLDSTGLVEADSSVMSKVEDNVQSIAQDSVKNTDEGSNLNSTSQQCEIYKKTLTDPKLETTENRRWSNYHIKYVDGEIYRIRYFYDDGPNGEYKKTILYKEDESEFAHMVKVYRGFETKELKDYFDSGEIIWEEQAYEATLNNKLAYWRKINGEFVDLNIDEELSCL